MTSSYNFIHLHNHTEYSFLDGAIRIPDLVKSAVKWNMPALAITDHGGLFGAIEFYDLCMEKGIKPILGFEAYIAPDSRKNRTAGVDGKSNHLILLAKNDTGWKNLMRLSSIGYLEGFYYKPRIDMEVIREHSEGLIATTACIAGSVPRAIIAGDRERAKKIAEEYLSVFGEGNFYFELQKHGIDEEIIAFEEMIKLGTEMGIPFIVTNDAHYLEKEDARAHEVLLCMQTQDLLSDPDHYRFSTDEMYLKSPEEMLNLFPELPEAAKNTVEIAERCSVKVHRQVQLPVPDIPQGFKDSGEYLQRLAEEGFKEKYSNAAPEIRERFDYELNVIKSMGFPGYFLIVRDFLFKADEMGILRGCRGSAAGSIVAYCIGITNVDPIKFDLIFERFLNPERVSMPDVDVDIADHDRYRVIEYVVGRYGRDSVCQIINFGRMKAKAAVKDVARVMGVSVAEANRLSSMIQEKTLEASIKANGELKATIEGNDTYKELIQYAKVLEGQARQPGMHAGGVIIAPSKLVEWIPLFKQSKNDIVMTQFDMKHVEEVGLIKIDLLGLRTLTVLQEACHLIQKYHNKEIKIWEIPDGDEKTFKLFHAGETTDVFQFESQGMQDYLRKLKPTCIEDLIAMAALYRPGPMNNIDSFIHRKHGKEMISYPHPILKEILDVTYGVIVYQEQVMRIAQKMGGFTLGQADILRAAMGKKQIDKMEGMKDKFFEGAQNQGIKKSAAKEIYALIEKFAEYGFNKAHATVYAHVGYQAAFLKSHYPLEYMTAVLTSHIGERDKFLVAKNEAERLGLKVVPPDVNRSDVKCSVIDGCISLGLSVIANVGKAAEVIIEARSEKGSFSSIYDLCRNVDLRIVNKKTLESLVMAGAMDSLPGTRAQLFTAIVSASDYGNSFQKDRMLGQTNLFSDSSVSSEGDERDAKRDLSMPEPGLPDVPPWPYNQLLGKEKEVLNFYMSGHPLDHYKDEIRGFSTILLKGTALKEKRDGARVVVGGVITAVKNITQRNGKPMAFIELEDFDGSIEIIAFADAYGLYGHLCAVDSMVLVRGALQKKEGVNNYKIIAEKIMLLSESREKLARSVHLKMRTQGLEEEFIKEIYRLCSKKEGSCSLIIHLVTQEENEYKISSKQIQISPLKEVIESLRLKLGQENVWLSQSAA